MGETKRERPHVVGDTWTRKVGEQTYAAETVEVVHEQRVAVRLRYENGIETPLMLVVVGYERDNPLQDASVISPREAREQALVEETRACVVGLGDNWIHFKPEAVFKRVNATHPLDTPPVDAGVRADPRDIEHHIAEEREARDEADALVARLVAVKDPGTWLRRVVAAGVLLADVTPDGIGELAVADEVLSRFGPPPSSETSEEVTRLRAELSERIRLHDLDGKALFRMHAELAALKASSETSEEHDDVFSVPPMERKTYAGHERALLDGDTARFDALAYLDEAMTLDPFPKRSKLYDWLNAVRGILVAPHDRVRPDARRNERAAALRTMLPSSETSERAAAIEECARVCEATEPDEDDGGGPLQLANGPLLARRIRALRTKKACGHSDERPVIGCCDPWGVTPDSMQRFCAALASPLPRVEAATPEQPIGVVERIVAEMRAIVRGAECECNDDDCGLMHGSHADPRKVLALADRIAREHASTPDLVRVVAEAVRDAWIGVVDTRHKGCSKSGDQMGMKACREIGIFAAEIDLDQIITAAREGGRS